MKDLFSCQTVRSLRWAYPFTQVSFTSAGLILPPEVSETFTQRRMLKIRAGSLHSKGSVNGASVFLCHFGVLAHQAHKLTVYDIAYTAIRDGK